jgi:hypothetical protein
VRDARAGEHLVSQIDAQLPVLENEAKEVQDVARVKVAGVDRDRGG